MAFLKHLQRKIETKTAEIQSRSTQSKSVSDEALFDFEDRYEKTCEKKADKIDSIETNDTNPDKNVAGFKRKLLLCKELETFCLSHGSGGTAYFKKYYSSLYEDIQKELDFYMKNEYAEAKEYFEEEKAKQKTIKALAGKILKEIESAGGTALQKDIRKQFPKDEPDYFNQAVKSLLDSKKIVKLKDGNFVKYKISR